LSGGVLTLAVTSITGMIILGGLGAVAIESQTSRSALDRIRRLANAAYEGIVVVQDGRINDANAAFCDLAGEPLEDLLGQPLFGSILTFDSDEASPATACAVRACCSRSTAVVKSRSRCSRA
jgi:PAS domain-containing protein